MRLACCVVLLAACHNSDDNYVNDPPTVPVVRDDHISIAECGRVTPDLLVAIADLDGDGKPDIVTSSLAGMIVLHNITTNGTLAFEAPITVTTDSTSGVVAADLDGDGRIDLASVGDGGWSEGVLAIRLGQG